MVNGFAQTTSIPIDKLWRGNFSPERLESIRSLSNGYQYTVLDLDYRSKSSKIIIHNYGDGGEGKVLIDSEKSAKIPFFRGYTFSKDENLLLLETDTKPIYRRSKEAMYWVYDRKSQGISLIFDYPVQEPKFSLDGNKVAFVYKRNIYVKDLIKQSIVQITFDGDHQTINGTTDWVYEEEFGFVRAFDWNASSTKIAFMRFDETDVPNFSMDIYGTESYQYPYEFRYPKAGEENAKVSMHLYDLEKGTTTEIFFQGDKPYYIPRFEFTPEENILSIQTINRHQNHLKLWSINTASNVSSVILEEQDVAYVDVHDNLTFLKDNSFLWTSDMSGFNHVYHYSASGKLIRQITKGQWEVTRFIKFSEKTREIYYSSVEKSSIGRGVYAIKINGRGKRALTSGKGYSGANFSADASYFIQSYSDVNTPPVYRMKKTKDTTTVRVLLNNNKLKETLAEFKLPVKEFSTLNINGEELNMWMIKPYDFDPNKKYPLLMFQYSGPGSQEVTNRWSDERTLWHKSIANKGYIVACVDGRGTGFKGAAFKKVTYMNLAKLEAIDQIDSARKLGEVPFVDAERIGIWGWSFGGLMAAHCLLTGNHVFSMAIAVAPVTNWRFYDTIYTERFLRTPQENPEGYDLNSPINYADQLEGKFLIIHGSGDDNVHVQNTMRMVEALVQADKQFDWMVYPDRNHGIYGGNTRNHLFQKMTNFIIDNL
jgi:dipeptidyl-peptidase-4